MQFWNPLTWFRWFGEFVQCWVLGIPWRDAPKAIPAIILSVVLFIIGFIAFNDSAGWRNRLLNRQLKVALDREDFPTAEIVVRRQLEADPNNSEHVFRFALIRAEQSYEDEAEVLMRRLLERRYIPAAKWLLQHQIIGKKFTDFEPEQLNEAGQVLKLISENDPENIAIKRKYAEYLLVEQRIAAAIPILDELSVYDPMLGLQAAALSRRLGDESGAKRYARKNLDLIKEMKSDDPTNAYLTWSIARNQVFLERYSEAIRTLHKSMEVVQSEEEHRFLSQALGDTIVAYVTYIEESPSNTVVEKLRVLRMLDAALKIAPNNPRVVTMVADHVLSSLNEDDEELVSVREALVTGSPLGISHFIKGTAALLKEDVDTAELHLELAVKEMPRSGAILNNLAVTLAMRETPDYEHALKIANAAIEQVGSPTPHFYETRGQILFRMGRLREAIPDLERALTEKALAPKAHEMLADCYREVGDDELAREHQDRAEQLRSEGGAGARQQQDARQQKDARQQQDAVQAGRAGADNVSSEGGEGDGQQPVGDSNDG